MPQPEFRRTEIPCPGRPARHNGRVLVVYYSGPSGNTHRFVTKLGLPAVRLPAQARAAAEVRVTEPFVLITPSLGAGHLDKALPRQVAKFLNVPENRARMIGVIGGGNSIYGDAYCIATDVVHRKTGVPVLMRFEVLGTREDVERARAGITGNWDRLVALRGLDDTSLTA